MFAWDVRMSNFGAFLFYFIYYYRNENHSNYHLETKGEVIFWYQYKIVIPIVKIRMDQLE